MSRVINNKLRADVGHKNRNTNQGTMMMQNNNMLLRGPKSHTNELEYVMALHQTTAPTVSSSSMAHNKNKVTDVASENTVVGSRRSQRGGIRKQRDNHDDDNDLFEEVEGAHGQEQNSNDDEEDEDTILTTTAFLDTSSFVIDPLDVERFLISRHGIFVNDGNDDDNVANTIVRELTQGRRRSCHSIDDDNDTEHDEEFEGNDDVENSGSTPRLGVLLEDHSFKENASGDDGAIAMMNGENRRQRHQRRQRSRPRFRRKRQLHEDDVEANQMNGSGKNNNKNNNDVEEEAPHSMDMVQMLSLILIPTLARLAGKNDQEKMTRRQEKRTKANNIYHGTLMQDVFDIIMSDVDKRLKDTQPSFTATVIPLPLIVDGGGMRVEVVDNDVPQAEEPSSSTTATGVGGGFHQDDKSRGHDRLVLDARLVRTILRHYGEWRQGDDHHDDDNHNELLVEEMIDVCRRDGDDHEEEENGLLFDVRALVRGLTYDIIDTSIMSVGVEDRVSTIYDDVGFFEDSDDDANDKKDSRRKDADSENDVVHHDGDHPVASDHHEYREPKGEKGDARSDTSSQEEEQTDRDDQRCHNNDFFTSRPSGPADATSKSATVGRYLYNSMFPSPSSSYSSMFESIFGSFNSYVSFGSHEGKKKKKAAVDSTSTEQQRQKKNNGNPHQRRKKNNYFVDLVLDTHSSLMVMLLTWLFYILMTFTYAYPFQLAFPDVCADVDYDDESIEFTEFTCRLIMAIIDWVYIAFALATGGLVILLPLSVGNNPNVLLQRTNKKGQQQNTKTWMKAGTNTDIDTDTTMTTTINIKAFIVAITAAIVYSLYPFATVMTIKGNLDEGEDPDTMTAVERVITQPFFDIVVYMTLVVGILVALGLCANLYVHVINNINDKNDFGPHGKEKKAVVLDNPDDGEVDAELNTNSAQGTVAVTTVGVDSDQSRTTTGGKVSRRRRSPIVTPVSTRNEYKIKVAAAMKINTMVSDALSLHDHNLSNYRRRRNGAVATTPGASLTDENKKVTTATGATATAMMNYITEGQRYELYGNFFFILHRVLFTEKLTMRDGIWLPSRLVIIQSAQVVVIVISLFLFYSIRDQASQQATDARQRLFEINADVSPYKIPDWVIDLIPSGADVDASLNAGALCALVVMILQVFSYIPSAVLTILKYRSGQIPSLREPGKFNEYRESIESVHMNTSNAIYSLLGSGILLYTLVGTTVFLFKWSLTQHYMKIFLASMIGLGITMTLKIVLAIYINKTFFGGGGGGGTRREKKNGNNSDREETEMSSQAAARSLGFYRTRPRLANITTLALECWYLGIGSSIVLVRIGQVILAVLYYVGRIDVHFLNDNDVKIFGYKFDYVPTYFTQELLLHEAHRHPYLERLGYVYLLKLKDLDEAKREKRLQQQENEEDEEGRRGGGQTFAIPLAHVGRGYGAVFTTNKSNASIMAKAKCGFASNRACITWRIIFVKALMPWMSQYRQYCPRTFSTNQ